MYLSSGYCLKLGAHFDVALRRQMKAVDEQSILKHNFCIGV